MKKHA